MLRLRLKFRSSESPSSLFNVQGRRERYLLAPSTNKGTQPTGFGSWFNMTNFGAKRIKAQLEAMKYERKIEIVCQINVASKKRCSKLFCPLEFHENEAVVRDEG